MNRELGYYWVWSDGIEEWEPAKWDGRRWIFPGYEPLVRPEDIDESDIGPKVEGRPPNRLYSVAGSAKQSPP